MSKLTKKVAREEVTRQIMQLREMGYSVEEFTPYQFRIEGKIDLYPTGRKYCILADRKWGMFNNAVDFIKKHLPL